jgi:hypothetical protein
MTNTINNKALIIKPSAIIDGVPHITREYVPTALALTNGGFFTVEYIQRTTKELKTMHATLHYKGATVGGTPAYNATQKRLTIVRDMHASRRGERPIRSLAWEGIQSILFQDTLYKVMSEEQEAQIDEQANLDYDSYNLGEF